MQRRSRSFCSTTVDTMKKIWPRNMDPTKIAEITGRSHIKTQNFLHAKRGNSTVLGQRQHKAAAVADLLNVAAVLPPQQPLHMKLLRAVKGFNGLAAATSCLWGQKRQQEHLDGHRRLAAHFMQQKTNVPLKPKRCCSLVASKYVITKVSNFRPGETGRTDE